jgi:flagellar biosynthesis anti-sigma factor FlgM
MKVNDSNPSSLGAAGSATPSPAGAAKSQKSQEIERTTPGAGPAAASTTPAAADDVHLSELVRSLRSLAADSPERQARLEQIARTYATGAYQVDTHATASKIIDDALDT